MNNKEKLELFKKMISEVSIKRYSQIEFVDIVNAIYKEIYGKKRN